MMRKYDFTGDLDTIGKACGFGVAIAVDDPNEKYIGTFRDDLPHGICIF